LPQFKLSYFIETETDAISYRFGNKYITVYNDNKMQDRIRWTLSHEIGHILMGHLDDYEETQLRRSGLNAKQYEVLEKEAHAFAGELLRPPVLLALVKTEEISDIQNVCKISYSAAKIGSQKTKEMKGCMYKSHKNEIDFYLKQFYNFINQKRCRKCNHTFIHTKAKYCPICGEKSLLWGNTRSSIYEFIEEELKNVKYLGIKVDNNCKAIICPVCKNEEIHPQYHRCKICSTQLTNVCAGEVDSDKNGNEYFKQNRCNLLAEGNARYCINCGSPTTFFRDNLLEHWEEEYNKKDRFNREELDIHNLLA